MTTTAQPALDGRIRLLLQIVATSLLEIADDQLLSAPRKRQHVLGMLEVFIIGLKGGDLPLDADWWRAINHHEPAAAPGAGGRARHSPAALDHRQKFRNRSGASS